jgi:hypothetical protein
MKKKIKTILILSILVQLIYIINKYEFHPNNFFNAFINEYRGNLDLPNEAIEIKNIIKKENLTFFNLSNKFKKNIYLYQRTVEYSYPSKFNEKNDIFFELIGENNNNCKIIKRYVFTQISKCTLK